MLPRLKVLVLRSNRFEGEMKCGDNWPYLRIIDISSNNFSGDLHHISFSSWNKMMSDRQTQLSDEYFGLNVVRPVFYYLTQATITYKDHLLKWKRTIPEFTSVDFSCNSFQGEIPEAIGDLKSLRNLNLSHNYLTGTIPKSLGKMKELLTLDLSVNQLTDTIPSELGQIRLLGDFNISWWERYRILIIL